MSKRIFAVIGRGMTDKTAVCVFPWELPILQLVHGQEVVERSIDEMVSMDGAIKTEKVKQKISAVVPPSLRQQYEIMAYVDPDEDPANDPAGEYQRMVDKYGMDKELPIPCVTRVFGEFQSGAFAAALEKHIGDSAAKPTYLRATEEGLGKEPSKMTAKELRDALSERGIEWSASEGKADLVAKLEEALAPA